MNLVGATAAFAAFTCGRTLSNSYLFFGCRGVLAKTREAA
jgi:hypothetical protein